MEVAWGSEAGGSLPPDPIQRPLETAAYLTPSTPALQGETLP